MYVPQTWLDGVEGGTPVNADRLNHIEQGLADAAAAAAAEPAAAALAPAVAAATERLAFDVTAIRPTFLTTLQLQRASVMQHAIKDPTTGDYYVTQTTTGTTGTRETATISRVSAAGVLLDYMILEDGGHGTAIALQRIDGILYLWLAYQAAPSAAAVTPGAGGNDLLRFAWRPSVTPWTRDTIAAQVMPKFGASYAIVAIDEATDTIAYRVSGGTSDTYQRRKLSEVQAGVDAVSGTVELSQGALSDGTTITMQGFATIDGDLYRYTGNTNGTTDPARITRYSWETGEATGVVDTSSLGVNADGTTPGDLREPEGIALYRDPFTGLPHLTAGVTTGPPNRRTYSLFVFAPVGGDQFRGVQLQALEGNAPVGKGGRARRMDPTNTALHNLTTPGWWYLTGAEFGAMTDRPADAVSTSGHWLFVSGTDAATAQTQTLHRSTIANPPAQWTRVIDQTSPTNASTWSRANLQAPLSPATTLPAGVTSMHQLTTPGWYYLSTAQYSAMTDRPADWVASGHFVHVSGTDGGTGNAQIQTIYRNTIGQAPMTWTRVIDQTTPTNQTKWQRYTLTEVAYAP